MGRHHLTVGPLPLWIDRSRLLGDADWSFDPETHLASAQLDTHTAADVATRLRNMGLDGQPLTVDAAPRLPRAAVRAARTRDAKLRRTTTPGFKRRDTRLDEEGRRSLTPEVLSRWIGKQAEGLSVLDAGCGAGGNTIGFARAGCTVTAVERDATRLAHARHNASVYGVAHRVRFIHGDAIRAMSQLEADILFLDPPWGDWNKLRTSADDFPLLAHALETGLKRFERIWAKVPASFDTTTIPHVKPMAVFGRAEGDKHRIKFLMLRIERA